MYNNLICQINDADHVLMIAILGWAWTKLSFSADTKYHFRNIECNIHIGRDCEKSAVDSRHPEWMEIKGMISQAIGERNNLEKQGILSFEEEYIHNFECRMHENLDKLEIQNKRDESRFYADEERRLINRLRKYYDNTFAWMRDFSLPHSNNLSERALRSVKSHCKVSGQFESVEYAKYHARLKTYLETCRRNGFNEILALHRLAEGNPVSVEELFGGK